MDAEHVDVQIARVATTLQHLLEQNAANHRETTARLAVVEDLQRKTNGNVSRHDEQIKTLFADRDAIRIVLNPKPDVPKPVEADRLPLTLNAAQRWVVFAVACIAGTWFVMTTVLGYTAAPSPRPAQHQERP